MELKKGDIIVSKTGWSASDVVINQGDLLVFLGKLSYTEKWNRWAWKLKGLDPQWDASEMKGNYHLTLHEEAGKYFRYATAIEIAKWKLKNQK